jgi:hypothetical protein
MSNITLPPINTAVATARPTTVNGNAATANLQTGFSAQNTFGTGQANFAALGAPDQAASSLQALTQVVQLLTQVVSAIAQLVTALKGGGAESAQAKPEAGGAGGAETPKTSTEAPKEAEKAETKPETGGAGGTGGAEQAKGAPAGSGNPALDFLSQLAPILSSLTELIKYLQQQEEAKADETKGKKGGKEGAHKKDGATNASAKGKEHANPNSKVGQQAMMEKMNQAIVQLLTSLIQVMVPLLQQMAGQLGKENPQVQAAGNALQDVMANTRSGGGLSGGVFAS